MSADQGPSPGRPSEGPTDPQRAVAAAREQVLGGRGPGADTVETARYQRERPTLGPLPTPLERELVHLHTDGVRGGVDAAVIRTESDRVLEVWRPTQPRSEAVARELGHPPRGRPYRWLWAAAATVVLALRQWRRRSRGR